MYWLGSAWSEVGGGEASLEEALDAAQRKFQHCRACGITEAVFAREEWQACLRIAGSVLLAALVGKNG